MKITSVRIYPADEPKLKAYVTITLDGCFVIRDLKIIEGAEGLFIAMPSKRLRDGSYRDIAHPVNAETREYLERTVLEAFAQYLKDPAAEISAG